MLPQMLEWISQVQGPGTTGLMLKDLSTWLPDCLLFTKRTSPARKKTGSSGIDLILKHGRRGLGEMWLLVINQAKDEDEDEDLLLSKDNKALILFNDSL